MPLAAHHTSVNCYVRRSDLLLVAHIVIVAVAVAVAAVVVVVVAVMMMACDH